MKLDTNFVHVWAPSDSSWSAHLTGFHRFERVRLRVILFVITWETKVLHNLGNVVVTYDKHMLYVFCLTTHIFVTYLRIAMMQGMVVPFHVKLGFTQHTFCCQYLWNPHSSRFVALDRGTCGYGDLFRVNNWPALVSNFSTLRGQHISPFGLSNLGVNSVETWQCGRWLHGYILWGPVNPGKYL